MGMTVSATAVGVAVPNGLYGPFSRQEFHLANVS
jgi:hypothetical protein